MVHVATSCLLLTVVGLLPVTGPYQWVVTAPDGTVLTGSGPEFEFAPLEPGVWRAELHVQYLHEDPANPGQLYKIVAIKEFDIGGDDLRLIFADGFETGTTKGWSSTTGGQDD